MNDPYPGYIPGFHGLRAFACLAVFGVHLQQRTGIDFQWGPVSGERLLLNGNTGVALLFMLSGFLLSREMFAGADKPSSERARFFAHRAARILPVYYCCLAAITLVTGQWRNATGIRDVVLHILLIHNLRDDSFYALSQPFWTLAVQCQFYAVFGLALPWLCWMARRLSKRALTMLFLALAVGAYFAHAAIMRSADSWIDSAGLSQVISPDGPAISRSLVAHLPIFLLGAAMFMLSRDWGIRSTTTWQGTLGDVLSIAVAAALLAILGTPWDDDLQVPFGRYNWPYVPALLGVLLLAVPRSRFVREFLEFRLIRFLGVLSYCFYIFHEPCLGAVVSVLSHTGASPHPALTAVAALTLSLVVSLVVHRVIERPCIKLVNPVSPYLAPSSAPG